MGVDIRKLIKKHAPTAITRVTYSQCSGQVWAIDASIFLYKFCYDPKKSKNPHIRGFYQMFKTFLSNGIRPILVFDGSVPDIKRHTVDKRKAERQAKQDRINASSDADEIARLEKSLITFPENTFDDVIQLCQIMHIPHLRANYEADALCIKLEQLGIVQGIVSNDSDILMFGGKNLYCNYDYTDSIDCINLPSILSQLSITYDLFVEMCVLCGTDYTVDTIPGVGSARALEIVRGGKRIVDFLTDQSPAINFDYQSAIDYVHTAPDDELLAPHYINVSIIGNGVDFIVLNDLMMSKCNCRKSTIPAHQIDIESGLVKISDFLHSDVEMQLPAPAEAQHTLNLEPKLKLRLKLKLKLKIKIEIEI